MISDRFASGRNGTFQVDASNRARSVSGSDNLDHVEPLERQFQQLKTAIHQELVESLDLAAIGEADRDWLWKQVRALAHNVCGGRKDLLSTLDRERLLDDLMNEIFGLGPLESLMEDPLISDILVNDPSHVYIEREGRLELTNIIFADSKHLMRIIQRIVARVGRRIDEVSPLVDARLPDGSRVNAIIPPLALDGPALSIRRFGVRPLDIDDLMGNNSLLPEMVEFLAGAIQSRIGCLISGGTGAGKTTLLNALSSYIPDGERLITIEDSAELLLKQRHWVRLETRPANMEGKGELSQRDLVKNSLRMRPDRIVVGEVRGPEVWDMLQAMNTGHEGSLTTVHANSAPDALSRLEMMVSMTGFAMPVEVVRQYVAAGIKLLIHAARLRGGARRVMTVTEIVDVTDGSFVLKEIFGFKQTGVDDEGVAIGEFYATGYQPQCLERLQSEGVTLPSDLFESRRFGII